MKLVELESGKTPVHLLGVLIEICSFCHAFVSKLTWTINIAHWSKTGVSWYFYLSYSIASTLSPFLLSSAPRHPFGEEFLLTSRAFLLSLPPHTSRYRSRAQNWCETAFHHCKRPWPRSLIDFLCGPGEVSPKSISNRTLSALEENNFVRVTVCMDALSC